MAELERYRIEPISELEVLTSKPITDPVTKNLFAGIKGVKEFFLPEPKFSDPLSLLDYLATATPPGRATTTAGKGIRSLFLNRRNMRAKVGDDMGGGGDGKRRSKEQLDFFTRTVGKRLAESLDDVDLVRLLEHHKKRFAQNDEYLKRIKDKKIITNQDEINTYINQAKEEIKRNKSMINDLTREVEKRRKAKGYVEGEPMELGQILQIKKQKLYKLQKELELGGGDMTPTVKKQTEQNIMKLIREINDLSRSRFSRGDEVRSEIDEDLEALLSGKGSLSEDPLYKLSMMVIGPSGKFKAADIVADFFKHQRIQSLLKSGAPGDITEIKQIQKGLKIKNPAEAEKLYMDLQNKGKELASPEDIQRAIEEFLKK